MHTSRNLHRNLCSLGIAVTTLVLSGGAAPGRVAAQAEEGAAARELVQIVDVIGDADDFHPGDARDIPTHSVQLAVALNRTTAPGLARSVPLDGRLEPDETGIGRTSFTHIFARQRRARVVRATLRLRLRSDRALSSDDMIRLDPAVTDLAAGGPGTPAIAIEHLRRVPPVPGRPYEVRINLRSVPIVWLDPARGEGYVPATPDATVNLLEHLQDGLLNVIISGTNSVDVSTLDVTVRLRPDRPPAYTIEAIPTLGGTENFAHAINNWGDVVGLSRLPGDAGSHSFLWTRGALIDLAPINSEGVLTSGPEGINDDRLIASGVMGSGVYYPALHDPSSGSTRILGSLGGITSFGFSGVATAVNRWGHAVGYSYLDGIRRHAFLYFDGNFVDLGSFGGYSAATGINDAGEIVGFVAASDGVASAFVHRDGQLMALDPFGGGGEGYARGINNLGQVVGVAMTPQRDFNAFIHDLGAVTNIGTLPGGYNSSAYAINDRGQVVGIANSPYVDMCPRFDGPGEVECIRYSDQAFLYRNGVIAELNELIPADAGWDLKWAFDINERGQITGYGVLEGRWRAFIATPAEPSPGSLETQTSLAR